MTTPEWPVQKLSLSPPVLSDLASAIQTGLEQNFTHVQTSVSTPPDLRQAPFHLAAPGLSGHPRIADIGGQPNLLPSPNLNAKYDLLSIAKLMDMPSTGSGLLIGAGAGPFHQLGYNSELMPNLALQGGQISRNRTHCAHIQPASGLVACRELSDSTGFGLMCNLLGCDGEAGPLLHIVAHGRTGPLNFTHAIQQAIQLLFGAKLISLGGVFVIHTGKAKMHVMPDFPGAPFGERKEVERWLRYFDMDAPMVCLSVLHSGDDGGLGLRMEHTHCFAAEGENSGERGGHYHYDLDETRAEVHYEGWFNVAETLYRIDRPEQR